MNASGKKSLLLPFGPEIEAPAEEARQEWLRAYGQVERLVADYRAKISKEIEEGPGDRMRTAGLEVGAEAFDKLQAWLQEIYEGKHGSGTLVIARDTPRRLARILPFQNPFESKSNKRQQVDAIERREVAKDETIPGPPALSLAELRDYSNFHSVKGFLSNKRYAEVQLGEVNTEELNELYQQLLKGGWPMFAILEAFPSDYKPKVLLGEVQNFGSCDHHSGSIEGALLVLPTGRFAVVSKYSGERNAETYGFHGVTADPRITPDWSARHGTWEGDELDEPNPEEIAFLRGTEIKGFNRGLLCEALDEAKNE